MLFASTSEVTTYSGTYLCRLLLLQLLLTIFFIDTFKSLNCQNTRRNTVKLTGDF